MCVCVFLCNRHAHYPTKPPPPPPTYVVQCHPSFRNRIGRGCREEATKTTRSCYLFSSLSSPLKMKVNDDCKKKKKRRRREAINLRCESQDAATSLRGARSRKRRRFPLLEKNWKGIRLRCRFLFKKKGGIFAKKRKLERGRRRIKRKKKKKRYLPRPSTSKAKRSEAKQKDHGPISRM